MLRDMCYLPSGWQEIPYEHDNRTGFAKLVCARCVQHAVDKPKRFQYPFSGANKHSLKHHCVSCGSQAYGYRFVNEIGFMPEAWTVRLRDGALFCDHCSTGRDPASRTTYYADKTDVHVDTYGNFNVVEKPHAEDESRAEDELQFKIYLADKQQTKGSDSDMGTKNTAGVETEELPPSRLRTQVGELGNAFAEGAKLAVVDEGGEIFIDIAKEVGKDSPIVLAMLEHEDGKALAKLIAAISIHSIASHTPMLPKPAFMKKIAEAQITVSSLKLIGPRLHRLRKHFEKLVGLGEQLVALETPAALPEGVESAIDFAAAKQKAAAR